MKRSAIRIFAVLLLGGCAESTIETEMANDKSPDANATVATETPADRTAASESVPDAAVGFRGSQSSTAMAQSF